MSSYFCIILLLKDLHTVLKSCFDCMFTALLDNIFCTLYFSLFWSTLRTEHPQCRWGSQLFPRSTGPWNYCVKGTLAFPSSIVRCGVHCGSAPGLLTFTWSSEFEKCSRNGWLICDNKRRVSARYPGDVFVWKAQFRRLSSNKDIWFVLNILWRTGD